MNKVIKTLTLKFEKIEIEKREKIIKLEKQKKWIDLVCGNGLILERRVGEALIFLGFKVDYPPESSHSYDLRVKYKDKELIIEIEGTKKSIEINKGRQLMHWLAEEDPLVQGVLMGNPFNNEPLTNRPPKVNQKLFTEALENLAVKRGFTLISSIDLFNLVCKKLKGEEIILEEIIDKMYNDKGIIEF